MFKRILTLTISLMIMAVFASYGFARCQVPCRDKAPEIYNGIYYITVKQKCSDENGKHVKMVTQKRFVTLEYQPSLENTYFATFYKTKEDARIGENACGESDFDFNGISKAQDVTYLVESAGGEASTMVIESPKTDFEEVCEVKFWGTLAKTDAYGNGDRTKTMFKGSSVAFCSPDNGAYIMCNGSWTAKWIEELPLR